MVFGVNVTIDESLRTVSLFDLIVGSFAVGSGLINVILEPVANLYIFVCFGCICLYKCCSWWDIYVCW